jgi:hypothetical protein
MSSNCKGRVISLKPGCSLASPRIRARIFSRNIVQFAERHSRSGSVNDCLISRLTPRSAYSQISR